MVASRTGGLPEIVLDGQTGALVETGNDQEMAAAIIKLLKDKPLAQKMGTAGRKRALEQFTLQKMTASFANLYSRLLAQAA